MTTLEEYAVKLKTCQDDPFTFFEKESVRDLKIHLHPDRWIGNEDMATSLFKDFVALFEVSKNPKTISGYTIIKHVARGDISDVYFVKDSTGKFVLRIPFVKVAERLLKKELKILEELKTDSIYGKLIPKPLKTVDTGVLYEYNDTISAAEVIKNYSGVDGRHIIWMLKRLLMVAGYAHTKGYVHGAITPDHTLFTMVNHGVILCDWIHAGKIGDPVQTIPAIWKDMYPEDTKKSKVLTPQLDINMAVKTVLMIGKDTLPSSLKRFLESCLMPFRMAPDNAWKLHDEVKDLSKSLYGNAKMCTWDFR